MQDVRVSDREAMAAFLMRMRATGIDDKRVFAAIEATPRRAFVPAEFHGAAFGSRQVPIACGETLEGLDLQASIISSLDIKADHRILEIGTGSGFTAAVMARLGARVTSVERFRMLHGEAQKRLQTLGLNNVLVRLGDAEKVVDGEGPFDRIIVWAAFESMPRRYTDLLSSGGVMISAIGMPEEEQVVARLVKVGSRFERSDLGMVRFQPLAKGLPAKL